MRRLTAIEQHAARIDFRQTDGLDLLVQLLSSSTPANVVVFADPPYTAGGKEAGRRLYKHNDLDHAHLFAILADSHVDFLMTYDASLGIKELIVEHRFHAVQVEMKSTHHTHRNELVITPRPLLPYLAAAESKRSS